MEHVRVAVVEADSADTLECKINAKVLELESSGVVEIYDIKYTSTPTPAVSDLVGGIKWSAMILYNNNKRQM